VAGKAEVVWRSLGTAIFFLVLGPVLVVGGIAAAVSNTSSLSAVIGGLVLAGIGGWQFFCNLFVAKSFVRVSDGRFIVHEIDAVGDHPVRAIRHPNDWSAMVSDVQQIVPTDGFGPVVFRTGDSELGRLGSKRWSDRQLEEMATCIGATLTGTRRTDFSRFGKKAAGGGPPPA
jgi:hypothetical protein